MRRINIGRVVLGGLVAGVVANILSFLINDVIMKEQHASVFKGLGKTMPTDPTTAVIFVVGGFVFAIALVWLYAAIRPRYGAGPGTAVRAGVFFWFLTAVFFSWLIGALGIFPFNAMQLVLELIADIVIALVGAWVYKEEGATA
jgi:hypothetical protein